MLGWYLRRMAHDDRIVPMGLTDTYPQGTFAFSESGHPTSTRDASYYFTGHVIKPIHTSVEIHGFDITGQ